MTLVGDSELDVFPLCLGGNVFGWTADADTSFAVLDAYAAAGGNFIDTAAVYSAWVEGNVGGESETIIGNWMAARGNRERVIVATKVDPSPHLTRDAVLEAADGSLQRLRSDYIDLFYIHHDDPQTPLEETLGAFAELVRDGRIRYIGVSNFNEARLQAVLDVVAAEGLPPVVALQNEYNAIKREDYEDGPRALAERANIGALPFFALASGYLTGKYRGGAEVESQRSGMVPGRLTDHAEAVVEAVAAVAAERDTTPAVVALAWLLAQPTVVAPIASARTVEQLEEILPFTELELSAEELDSISRAG